MLPIPPTKELLDALQFALVPAAGGAALVAASFLALGRWAAALGSAAAVAAGFAWANYTAGPWLVWGSTSLLPWQPTDPAKPWEFLPRAAVGLLVVGLVSRWVGLIAATRLPERRRWGANLLVWAPRVAAVAVVSGWLVSPKWAAEFAWLTPALAAALLLSWAALDNLSRSGRGTEAAAYLAAMLVTAGVVLLYHHWASVSFVALIVGAATFGVAAAAGAAKADASGAIPAGVAFLPGLLLAGRMSQDSNIPLAAFWVLGLGPLALLPFLAPTLAAKTGWRVTLVRAVLVLTPVLVAAVLTATHETPAVGTES